MEKELIRTKQNVYVVVESDNKSNDSNITLFNNMEDTVLFKQN